MYIAGGTSSKSHRRRFYHVLPHEMIQLDNLPFDFGHGTCKGEVGPESKVSEKVILESKTEVQALFCFAEQGMKECWSWDSHTFEQIASTDDQHFNGQFLWF